MSLSSIPRSVREQVVARNAGRCLYCRLRQVGQGAVFHVNHIIPRSKGGGTALENLVLQCPWCSLHKADKTGAIDPDTGEFVQIFHPLRQSWQEHFSLQQDGTCSGLTETGRATIHALHMNDLIPKTARAIQVMLGLP